jgi:hypothetical protein
MAELRVLLAAVAAPESVVQQTSIGKRPAAFIGVIFLVCIPSLPVRHLMP